MKKILIISAFYAPKIHVASNRALAMAKYLKKSGFDVTVISEFSAPRDLGELRKTQDQGIEIFYVNGSHFLNRETFFDRPGFVLHKLKSLKNKLLNFFVMDDMPGFYQGFKRVLLDSDTLHFQDFDFVLSTYAPLSSHLIGWEIKKKFPKVKWIADFRDEMSFLPNNNLFLKKYLRSLEKKILSSSDIVTTISAPLLRQFKSLISDGNSKFFLEVRNGYDFELHLDEELQREVFKIVYAGTFYGPRNPLLFFEALKQFLTKYPDQQFQFDIYGGNTMTAVPALLSSYVHLHKNVTYQLIREKLINATCLLLIEPSEGRTGGYTGKLFDYLAINRPILAYVKKHDVASQLIHHCKAGYVSEYYKADEVFQTLELVYQSWAKNQLPERNWEIVKQQSRENQISKLIELLKNLPEMSKV